MIFSAPNAPRNIASRRAGHVLLPLAAIFLATACKADASEKLQFATIEVTLKEGEKPFTLEVADTEPKRELGLMNRKSMPGDHGMLFIFDKADRWTFWMKDTLIPLDVVFLDGDGKIVGIFPLKPKDESYVSPGKPAWFAIELNAGTAKALGLKIGQGIALPDNLLKAAHSHDEK